MSGREKGEAVADSAADSFPNFKVKIEDLSIHFIHQKSTHANAIPLILIHGWVRAPTAAECSATHDPMTSQPGSFAEFLDTVPLLVDPPVGEQAFHVVVPSQPGFTFSDPPRTSKWTMPDTARIFDKLMTGLGYKT